jgi:hypothetical protein
LIFSDAQPVQFWLANCETYNEKEVDGIFSKCFCGPFNCDDEITIQFKGASGYTYTLVILLEDLTTVTTNFSEVSTGVYQKSFTPTSLGICDEQIRLYVTSASGISSNLIVNGGFDSGSNWTTGGNWSIAAGQAEFDINVSETTGGEMYQNILTINSGDILTIVTEFVMSNFDVHTELIARLYNPSTGGYQDTVLWEYTVGDIGGTYNRTFELMSSGTFTRLVLIFTNNGVVADGGYSGNIRSISMSQISMAGAYKSDCLDIKTSHEETTLINYRNNRAFASLNSSVGTPDPEFNIRIPSVFFKERFPEESEVMELSNSTSVQLNAQVKAQRLLNIGPMPFYMHRKMKLVLKFQEVTIDGQEWTQEETYELAETRRTHPLSKAAVWLTEKDYIMRNVL